MTELPSNDYISQINQNGSGLNIPQIVGAIVDAEIEPVRGPVVKQQAKVEAAISGLADLKSSAELTNQNIANLKSTDVSIATRSTDTDVLTVEVTDQSELQVGVSKITSISQLAQAHSHSIPAEGSSPAVFTGPADVLTEEYRLKIRLGTYNLTAGAQTFTPNGTDPDIPEIQFSQGESITTVAVKLDQIEGINAKVVNTVGNSYKIMITGETGLDNAFEIQTLPITINASDMVNGSVYNVNSPTSYSTFASTMVIGDWYEIVDTDSYAQDADDIVPGREYKIVNTDVGTQDDAADMVAGRWYRVVSQDSNAQSSAQNIQVGAYYRVISTDAASSNATNIDMNKTYRVTSADAGTQSSAQSIQIGKTYRVHSNDGSTNFDSFHSGASGATQFTATVDGNVLSGDGVVIQTTDFSLLNGGVNVGVGATFTANAVGGVRTGPGTVVETTDFGQFHSGGSGATTFQATSAGNGFDGPGIVVQYTNFDDYASGTNHNGVNHEFKCNASAAGIPHTGPGKVVPFTNYMDEFNSNSNAIGTIFGLNRRATITNNNVNSGGANTGPGRVEAYTNFDLDYGADSNTAGQVFEATAAGTAATGSGTVRPYTNFNIDYGSPSNNNGQQFTASGGPFKGGGTVTLVSEDVFGDNNYRIFDTWKDHRNADGSQLRTQDLNAKDIIFDLNGLEVKRETNIVTDVVPGASFEILKTSTVGAEIITGADKESLMLTVNSFIDELNAYRADLKALSRSDRTGGDLGQLHGNPYVKSRLRSLSEFMLKPIYGYTSFPETSPVYLSQLGFKTQKDGTYGLDQNAFDTTFNNAPGNFDALTKDHAFSKHPEVTVVWDGDEANTKAGIYQFHHVNGDHAGGDGSGNVIYEGAVGVAGEKLYRGAATGGGFSYSGANVNSSGDFPGLFLRTTSTTIGDDVPMNVHLGKSFATLFAKFHDEVLNDKYIHRRQVANIEIQNEMLLERIERLDLRRNTLAQTYNKEFQAMEEMVTSFKSTGDYLTSVVDAWNK
jgi:flagellar capping protein FliD